MYCLTHGRCLEGEAQANVHAVADCKIEAEPGLSDAEFGTLIGDPAGNPVLLVDPTTPGGKDFGLAPTQ